MTFHCAKSLQTLPCQSGQTLPSLYRAGDAIHPKFPFPVSLYMRGQRKKKLRTWYLNLWHTITHYNILPLLINRSNFDDGSVGRSPLQIYAPHHSLMHWQQSCCSFELALHISWSQPLNALSFFFNTKNCPRTT